MGYGLYDRVWEVLVVSGTGTITTGTTGAPGGYLPIEAAAASGELLPYVIVDKTTTDWEVGMGTYTSGTTTTLSRLYVLKSSASNALVNFAGNQCDVFIDDPAETARRARFGVATGRWYGYRNSQSPASVSPDAGQIDYAPLFLGKPHLYQNIAVYVSTAPTASTQLRLGLYADADGAPGALIWDAGTVTITGPTQAVLSLAGAPPLWGCIWGAIGSPSTINGMDLLGYNQYNNPSNADAMGTNSDPFWSSGGSTAAIVGYTQSGFTFGALPSVCSGAAIRDQSAMAAVQLQA
jgi:hypothetical protein